MPLFSGRIAGVWLRADPAIYGDDEVDKIPHPLPRRSYLGLKYRLHMLWPGMAGYYELRPTNDGYGAKRIRKLWSVGKFTN